MNCLIANLLFISAGLLLCLVYSTPCEASPPTSRPAGPTSRPTQPKTRTDTPTPAKAAPTSRPVTSGSPSQTKPQPQPMTRAPAPARRRPKRRNKRSRRKQKRILIRGVVMQKGKRHFVEGAGVFFRELRRGVYTDEKGAFSIKLRPGTYQVIVKPMGFLPLRKKLALTRAQTLTFYVSIDPKNPFQTVVREKREKMAPAQLTIGRKEVREMPGGLGGDPFRVLQNLPGVARSRGLSGALRIRGASPADTGFYLDGHRIPLLFHFNGGPALINDRFIQNINFFPGGAPVSYGRLTAGLVSVDSRDPSQSGLHGEAYLDIVHAGFFFEIPLTKQWSIAAAARRSYVDAFFFILTPDALTARYWDYQLKVSYRTRDHNLSLFIFGSDDLVDYEGRVKGDSLPFLDEERFRLGISFARAILKYVLTRGIVTWRTSVAFGFDRTNTDDPDRSIEIWSFPIQVRSELRLQLHQRFRLDLGFEGGWQRYDYRFRFPVGEIAGFPAPSFRPLIYEGKGEKDLYYPGAFLSMTWNPIRSLALTAGARADLYHIQDRFIWGFDPRFSAEWKVDKRWTALFSVGLYHRPPEIEQWSEEVGNPNLGLQAAVQFTAGAKFQPFKQLEVRALLFYSHMFDRINGSGRVIEVDGKLQRENYNNAGLGRGYGLEVLVRLRDYKGLSAWLAYTLSRSERGNIRNGIDNLYGYDQPHILNLILQYRLRWGISLGLRFRLVSGRPTTPVLNSVYDADTDRYRPVYGKSGSERYPPFHQLDLRIDKTWTFNTWTLGLYLDLMNVYNAQPTEQYRYQYDYNARFPIPGLPFIPALGIRGSF